MIYFRNLIFKRFLYLCFLFIFSSSLYAQETKGVDCIILEDENSIICKYSHKRVNYEKKIILNWIEPDGKITRIRELSIPAGHGSVYDYRYIKGRTPGIWTFTVTDAEDEYKTNFTIAK